MATTNLGMQIDISLFLFARSDPSYRRFWLCHPAFHHSSSALFNPPWRYSQRLHAIIHHHIPQYSPWTPVNFNVASAPSGTNAENTFSATAVLIRPIGPIAARHATALSSERTSSGAIYEHALERKQTVSRSQDDDAPVVAASGSRKPAIQRSHASAACRKAPTANTPPPQPRLAGNSRTPPARRLTFPILLI